MDLSPSLSGALDAVQDAVLGHDLWPEALQRLVEALGATSGLLIPHEADLSLRFQVQQESAAHIPFSQVWFDNLEHPEDDPHWARPCTRPGPCVVEDDITTEDERARLHYYCAVARRGDRDWWAMLRMATPGGDWCMPLYRRGALGPFGREEAARLGALAPVIGQLVARCERIAQAEVGGRLEGIDDLGRAAFAIDWSGAVLCRNAAAGRIEGPDLWVSGRRLRAADKVNAARIRTLVAAAVLRPGACEPVVLHRDREPWIVIDAMPVTRRTTEVFANARAVLVASPVATGGLPPVPLLRAAFGLTPAEARLAQELAAGQGLAQAAVAMGIGRETARSHLDALFDKTGCRRQATLAMLLARIAQTVRH